MSDEDRGHQAAFLEWKRRNIFTHSQRGLYYLEDLPQDASIEESAFSTGWWELDQIFRFYPGQFTVVTGATGHGKSTLFFNIICNLVRANHKAFMYVPENERLLRSKLLEIWRNSYASFPSRSVLIQSAANDLYENALTLDWVLEQAIVAVKRDKVSIIYIDPWNELERAKPHEMLLTDYIGQLLMLLKQFARQFKVAVVLASHPTKAIAENGRSRVACLYDIEGSAHWANKCDNGLIVHREAETTRVISAKVREIGAGKLGTCYFRVDGLIFTPQYGAV